jgi:phosphoribosyl 1,2-cyclic phosphodiesterase
MRVTVLGSGSAGNATLVEAGGVRILIDAGFSGRDMERRLCAAEIDPESVSAIVITHDHGDHTRGMGVLARRFGLPLYMTRRTHGACASLLNGTETVHAYSSTRPFTLGTLEVRPFLTVHDAVDPVAVTVRDTASGARLGIATDLGRPTAAVRAELAGCNMLVLEANHDDAMLWTGPYPWSVKQRIASSHGHLSNRAAAELARELFHAGLRTIVLAHLSEHCNHAHAALDAVSAALSRVRYRGTLEVAPQEAPMEAVRVRPALPEQMALAL